MNDPILEVEGISYSYSSGVPVIENWSNVFFRQKMVAITGPSGRGKSTLLYVLGLMTRANTGRITVDGKDVQALGDLALSRLRAELFGFVFQDAALDPTRSVLDSITEPALYGAKPRSALEERALRLMSELGVTVPPKAKPRQISGGQAQRIALCRALIMCPQIILADEPTGNLDELSKQLVLATMRSASDGGASVIIVTHDQTVVAACDRVIQL